MTEKDDDGVELLKTAKQSNRLYKGTQTLGSIDDDQEEQKKIPINLGKMAKVKSINPYD